MGKHNNVTRIDHPSQADWHGPDTHIVSTAQAQELTERFGDGRGLRNPGRIIDVVGAATLRSSMIRHAYEQGGRVALGIDPKETHEADSLKEYTALAGKPNHLGAYVLWFADTAAIARQRGPSEHCPYVGRERQKIGLELGGQRHGGSWREVDQLRQTIDAIPDQLAKTGAETIFQWNTTTPTRNLFMPIRDGVGPVDFALLRQRRPVADMISGRTNSVVQIFGESLTLVLPGELEGGESVVQTACEGAYKPVDNDETANAIRGIYEQVANSSEARATTTAILPISTHYVMVAPLSANAYQVQAA